MRFIGIALAVASMAAAQTSQVFHLTQNETQQQINEIATTIRSIGNIPQIMADVSQGTVSVSGTPAQLDMAGWLLKELDCTRPLSGLQKYRPATGTDDAVQVFFLVNPQTPQELQEIVTNVRSVGDIRQLSSYYTLRAVVIRGTSGQIAMAAWIISQLDQPVGSPSPAPNVYTA